LKVFFYILVCHLWASSLGAQNIIEKLEINPPDQASLVQSIMPVQVNDAFEPRLLDITKRLILATDKFEDAQVDWNSKEHRLNVTVSPKVYFQEIIWDGDDGRRADVFRQACVLTYEPRNISKDRLGQISQCLLRQAKGRGYLDAEISVESKQQNLVVHANLGEIYFVEHLNFLENEKLSDGELLEVLSNQQGKPFEAAKLEDDTKALLRKYFDEGFYFAEVFKPTLKVDPDRKIVSLTWKIKESYAMEVQFTGHRKSKKLLNQYIEREQTFPAWFVDEIVDQLASELKEDGYLTPEITVTRSINQRDVEVIDIHTRTGARAELLAPEWVGVGNKKEIDRLYQSISALQPGSSFKESEFKSELNDTFIPLLLSDGYLDVHLRNLDFVIDREKSLVRPVIYLNEGDVTVVRSAAIVGLPSGFEHVQEVKDLLNGLQEGKPYNAINADRLQVELQRKLVSVGFLDAKIDKKFSTTNLGADVVMTVSSGVRYKVAKVLVRGAMKTDYEVLRREVLLSAGDYYEDEKIKDSISHIFRLGLARSVDIQVLEKDAERGEVYALVDVYEAARFRFEMGPGYGTLDGLRGVFKATYANIGGTARRLTLYAKGSRRFGGSHTPDVIEFANPEPIPFVQRRVSIEYFEPSFLKLPVDGRLNYTHAKEEKNRLGEENSFTASLDYRWNRHWLFTSMYELAFSDPFNVQRANMKPGDDKSKRFTNVGEIAVIDYLNDSFNPSKGFRSRLEGDLYDKHLGGEVNFWQTSIRQEFFWPLWIFRKNKLIGFGLNMGAGFSGSYDTSVEVPLEKRSQIGGESTVRGFAQGSINPKFNGVDQEGGNSYFFFQSEFNIPLAFGVDLLGFFDGGDAYLKNKNFKPWDLRYGAGPGLRWNTPVGPLKVGYGFALFRREGEPIGQLYIGVGPI
jgi:outer membrane protein insertion porin family